MSDTVKPQRDVLRARRRQNRRQAEYEIAMRRQAAAYDYALHQRRQGHILRTSQTEAEIAQMLAAAEAAATSDRPVGWRNTVYGSPFDGGYLYGLLAGLVVWSVTLKLLQNPLHISGVVFPVVWFFLIVATGVATSKLDRVYVFRTDCADRALLAATDALKEKS